MAESTPAILQVDDLCVRYGQVEAVSRLSLRVEQGKVTTLLGPNGAGKTTTLAAIMGLMASTGEVMFDGRRLTRPSVEERVLAGMALVPESRELFGTMSIEDNLVLGAVSRRGRLPRDSGQVLDEIYATFPRLAQRRRQAAGTLSGGERQMLALGRALMAQPRLLMLDEPSLGLAPLIVREIFAIVGALRAQGVAVLLVEQNARAALEVADHAYVLETGRIKLEGAAAELRNDPRVIETYLGLNSRHQDRLRA